MGVMLNVALDERPAVLWIGAAGDPNVPAGEVTWTAAAAPLAAPWPDEEQALLERRPQLVAMTAATAAHLAGATRHC